MILHVSQIWFIEMLSTEDRSGDIIEEALTYREKERQGKMENREQKEENCNRGGEKLKTG